MKMLLNYFTRFEKFLFSCSFLLIIFSFLLFDRENYLSFSSSLVGVISVAFCAKGNPLGHVFGIIFSIFYSIISFSFAYYGELITYLFMTLPMAVFSLVSWLKNPHKENKAEVAVGKIGKKDVLQTIIFSIIVTIAFYFILRYLNTTNLLISTISITTSFAAAFLSYKRSEFYALAYALNDLVLIILWILAVLEDTSYISVIICFVVFLVNDIYAFLNWRKMKMRQALTEN